MGEPIEKLICYEFNDKYYVARNKLESLAIDEGYSLKLTSQQRKLIVIFITDILYDDELENTVVYLTDHTWKDEFGEFNYNFDLD